MKKLWLAIATTAVFVSGCNAEQGNVAVSESEAKMQIVEVEILTAEKVNANEAVLLEAQVTQGNEFVNDADNVTFEVWESGLREQGKMIDGVLTEDGKYSVEYIFDHDGVYYMFAHTNARGLHIMPKQQITVGDPDMSQVLEDTSSDSMGDMDGHGESHESDEQDQGHSHD